MYLKTFGTKPIKKEEIEEKNEEQEKEETLDDIATTENVSIFEETPEQNKINYKFIGMAFEKYVILEIENEVYLLDQKVAEERILYESIINSINSGENGNSQLLLIPDVITLSHKDMEIVKDNAEMLKKAGFIFDNFGENTVKLTEVPEICADLETKEVFLARDRFGIKPLYYCYKDDNFLFASMIKPILKSKVIKPYLSKESLGEILALRTLKKARKWCIYRYK